MAHDPDANAPPSPSPASQTGSEESVVRSPASHHGDADANDDEDEVRDVDPHPDTPDDFDEDASSPRESIEAVNDAGGDDEDD